MLAKPSARANPCQGSVTTEALLALALLSATGLASWQAASQATRLLQTQQTWMQHIQWLDNASQSVHVFGATPTDWQSPPIPSLAVEQHGCVQQACSAAGFARSEAQWWLGLLHHQSPQVQANLKIEAAMTWQAGSSQLSMPLWRWQLRWPDQAMGPSLQQLELVITP